MLTLAAKEKSPIPDPIDLESKPNEQIDSPESDFKRQGESRMTATEAGLTTATDSISRLDAKVDEEVQYVKNDLKLKEK
jgi:hypothetical protein